MISIDLKVMKSLPQMLFWSNVIAVTFVSASAAVAIAQTPSDAGNARTPSYESYANAFHHATPAWSPDDRELIYAAIHLRRPAAHLYRVSASGGSERRVFPDDTWSANGAWSPDGKRIVFACQRSDGKQICTANPDGGDLRQITHENSAYNVVPTYSPDQTLFAYTTARTMQVMLSSADGASVKRFAAGVRPRFSPDGTAIAYTAPIGAGLFGRPVTGAWGLYIKPVSGGTAKLLASSKTAMRGWPSGCDYSPDGRQVVFVRHVNDGSAHGSELVFIQVDTDTVVRRIPLDGTVHDPAWSHDGNRIAYMLQTAAHPGELRVLNLADASTHPITRQPQQGSNRLVFYPSGKDLTIPAYLFDPPPHKQRRAGLIWIHGGEPGTGSFDGTYDPTVRYFVDQGFTVLAPNYRGSIGWSERVATVDAATDILEDIEAARTFMVNSGLADGDRVGLVGFSFGGYVALLSAATYPRAFSAVVDFSGPTDLAALYREKTEGRPVMLRLLGGTPDEKPDAYRAISPVAYAGRILSPVLMFHATADQIVPYTQATMMADALKASRRQVRLVTLASDHAYSSEDELRAYPEAAAFLLQQLRVAERVNTDH